MQLNRPAKLSTVIGLITVHVDYHISYTFVTYFDKQREIEKRLQNSYEEQIIT